MPSTRAVVLLSGGLDSSVAAAMGAARGWRQHAFHVDYGQRAAPAEERAARRVARALRMPFTRVALPWLGAWSGAALTSRRRAMPRLSGPQLDDLAATRRSAAAVWVPNRNGVMLNAAAAFAEARGIRTIVAGFNAEEARTFPDNSVPYLRALNRALEFSTANGVRLVSPTARKSKVGIARWAVRHGFDLSLCWPCYEGGRRLCGRCESCARFRRAVETARG